MSARLDRLVELEQAATKGPWVVDQRFARGINGRGHHAIATTERVGKGREDAALIAESRNALPALIAVARAAKVVSDGFAMLEPAEDNPLADLAMALARLDADPAGEETS